MKGDMYMFLRCLAPNVSGEIHVTFENKTLYRSLLLGLGGNAKAQGHLHRDAPI